MIYFDQLHKIIDGELIQMKKNLPVVHLAVDSRKAFVSSDTLFFAIRGYIHDGHQYIPELYKRGMRQFVVEKEDQAYYKKFSEANFIKTESCINALQQLATHHRKRFTIPIIAITGSNGKTIVKEWLSQLFSSRFNVVRSPKSYNSQIGVPLSIWQIKSSHEIGIFEAGISQSGEMEKLQKVIQPSLGIFTNVGTAHQEGFSTRLSKVEEKAKLFKSCKTIFYCKDYEDIDKVLQKYASPHCQLCSWSLYQKSDIQIYIKSQDTDITVISLRYKGESFELDLPFSDKASVENCMHCVAVLVHQNFGKDQIQQGIRDLEKVSMRLELKHGLNDCYLIDDSYNNDFAGLIIALDFLVQQNQYTQKTVILSDMLETGVASEKLYHDIAKLLKNKHIDRFIGVGQNINRFQSLFDIKSAFFEHTEDLLNTLHIDDFNKEVILVKGARKFGFERIVRKLQQKIHRTQLEINLDALTHNLNFYRSKLKDKTKIMVMVKAFAYGSGSFEVANLLQFHRVDYLAVAYADEGVALRENGVRLPIMVMNPSPDSFDKLLDYDLEPEIYSLKILNELTGFLTSEQIIKIHIKLDTGMRRLGFEERDRNELIKILRIYKNIEVASLFSHLAGADEDMYDSFSHQQVEKFINFCDIIENELLINPLRHIVNSSGIIRFPLYHFDMVRLGLGLYGIEANDRVQSELMPIGTLKTTISQIKQLKKGATVGYGRKGQARQDLKIATIAIGYADGLNRRLSNGKGKVLIKGRPAPIIGNICMDMAMVDITGIQAEEGDEVIIFGEELPITELAESLDTIPYEILTSISERVKRIYFTE